MISNQLKFSEEGKLNKNNIDYNENKILCLHCKRTKNNGLSCIGKCVADSEY